MSGLDRMKIRLGYVGGSAEGRILKDRLKTLHKALNYSYQSSTIVINDEEHKALINPDRLKMDYDDKIISADFELNLKPGDIFYWKETKTNWIIYSQQLAERAYFRGFIRDCRHQIKWKNELGQIRTTYAAVRGPVETKVVNDMKRGITYDIPNYTLSILIPDTEENKKTFKRYYRLMLDGITWEVQTADHYSTPGIIELNLKEDYSNKELNTDEIYGGKIVKNIEVSTSLDDGDIPIDSPYELWTKIIFDGNYINLPYEYEVVSGNARIIGSKLTISDSGEVHIKLSVPEIDFEKTYIIVGTENPDVSVVYNISGPLLVKPFGETSYSIDKYVNGIKTNAGGSWIVTGDSCSIAHQSSSSITLKWLKTKSGKIKLVYHEDEHVIEKEIIIQSLF